MGGLPRTLPAILAAALAAAVLGAPLAGATTATQARGLSTDTPWICTGSADTVGECNKVACGPNPSHPVGAECEIDQEQGWCSGGVCVKEDRYCSPNQCWDPTG